jgi:uncharacterized membrane protein (UPF0127 family)
VLLAAALAHGCRSSVDGGHGGTGPAAEAGTEARSQSQGPMVILKTGDKELRVKVELARTNRERALGLMFRKVMPADAGMLFLFDHDEVQSFWMKNTFIPLDMIFISADLKVVGVVENAEPHTTEPRTVGLPSRFVLEVNAGVARAHGVAAGTEVRFVDVPLQAP